VKTKMTTSPTRPLRIALIPGDGIGQEVVPAARQVLDALKLPLEFIELAAGWGTFQQQGTALPEATVAALQSCAGALFGAVSSPSQRVAGYSSPIIALRKRFDLYANLRPVISAPVPGSQAGIDMLIVRENTECLYVKQEHFEDDGNTAIAKRVITRRASQRIAKMAFEQALMRTRHSSLITHQPLVTVVHKANVLSLTDGLFRESALTVAAEYPDVKVEEQLVDSMIYRMIREPQRYDVVVAPNLYGDIISDAAAALVGGLGLAPSANVGDHFIVVEPVHGSAPDIAGKGVANPMAAILAAGLLLTTLGHGQAATAIQQAVDAVLRAGLFTPDLGGTATTSEVTTAILHQLAKEADTN
jgi:homoisocitrate dehydrogenase